MPVVDETISVLVPLSKPVYEQAVDSAARAHRSIENELAELVETGIRATLSHQERFDRLSSSYRARLAREGKLDQTPDEILAELRAIRENVADELYPD